MKSPSDRLDLTIPQVGGRLQQAGNEGRRRQKTVSIRSSLMRTMVILIVAISATMLAAIYFGTRNTIRGLCERLIDQASDQAEDAMENFFHSIEGLVDVSHAWWDAGLLEYRRQKDVQRLNALFVPVLKQHQMITSMMVAHGEGFEYLLFRDLRGGDEYEWYNRIVWADRGPEAGSELLWTSELELFRKGPLPEDARTYDPRKRPFYTEPVPGKPHWTNPYYFFITKDAGMTVAGKWTDPESGQTRLVAFDLLLMDLSRFTVNLRPSKNGKLFVMHPDGSLLGLPIDDRWKTPAEVRHILRNPAERAGGTTKSDRAATLLTADDLELESVGTAVRGWRSKESNKTGMLRFTTSDGEGWWAGFRPFPLGNQRLWIGVVIPERDFLSQAKQQRNIVLGICGAALLAAVAISFVTARRYSRPLEALALATERARDLDLAKSKPVRSELYEINQLAIANAQMMAALDSFSKYVPLELVRQLLNRGEVAKIGGKTHTLTILFTDIKGFTNLSEQMPPAELTAHMAEYFDVMLGVLNEERSTVDKFIGDAIVAFWGAPEPDDMHAIHAVLAVLRCRELLRQRNSEWQERGLPPLRTRFGLSTGEAVVGNVGAHDRLNYTVLGDTANLANRLEALNARYRTDILAGESVVVASRGEFLWRIVDTVSVKGRKNTIRISEPLCRKADATNDQLTLAKCYEEAFTLYTESAFGEAEKILSAVLENYPKDGPSAILLKRCRRYRANPPGDNWDGVTRFGTK
jgi:adenylate cyclase